MSIRLYCVGIHFRKDIAFKADALGEILDPEGKSTKNPPDTLMSGYKILQAAAHLGLRYKLTGAPPVNPLFGHLAYVSYTPQVGDTPAPRVTFGGVFPFFGQPLSLTEQLAPIGQISQVLQYSVRYPASLKSLPAGSPPSPATRYNSGPTQIPTPAEGEENPNINPDNMISRRGESQFGVNGFPDGCEIRVRLMSIYCTS